MKKLLLILPVLLILAACGPKEFHTELEQSVDTIEVNSDYDILGCTLVYDDESYDMELKDHNVDLTTVGNYTVYYEYKIDEETYKCQRMVFVTDQTKPVFTLNTGLDSIQVNTEWTDAGAEVTDNYDTTLEITVVSNVDITTPGTYEVTYTATDTSGNTNSITRYVSVFE